MLSLPHSLVLWQPLRASLCWALYMHTTRDSPSSEELASLKAKEKWAQREVKGLALCHSQESNPALLCPHSALTCPASPFCNPQGFGCQAAATAVLTL